MDKYRLVEEKFINAHGFIGDDKNVGNSRPNIAEEAVASCTLRVTQQAKPRSCITDAMTMLEQKKCVELKAMGKAINKAVTIAEILKRKLPLHQITTLSSCEIINVYEPLEEGLDTVVNQHYVSCLTITLSEDSSGLDVNDKGYQPPLSLEEIQGGDASAPILPDTTPKARSSSSYGSKI
ncbi:hypothetical protein ACHAWX_000659 [Stephanocyclus meneghinianus]